MDATEAVSSERASLDACEHERGEQHDRRANHFLGQQALRRLQPVFRQMAA
jgi:hypothetical protein